MDYTRLKKADHICPYCLAEVPVTVWQVVDAQADPDLREALLRKQLQRLDCPNCGRQYILDEPLLYLDAQLRIALYIHPALQALNPADGEISSPSQAQAEPVDREALLNTLRAALPEKWLAKPGWRLRLCATYNDLLEKIHLFEAGLEDQLVETVKLALASRLLTDENKRVLELRFLASEPDRLLFQAQYDEWIETESGEQLAQPEPLALSPDLYARAQDLLSERLAEEGEWELIDETYARQMIGAAPK